MRRLFLIDASTMIHRAFHALPNFTTRQGFPTGAIMGYIRMLLKVIREGRPDLVGVCFDAKGPVFRHELDPEYKANRPPADPDLVPQFPVIREVTAAFGLPVLEKEGFEADDLIATLARQGQAQGDEVVIVSSDKDLMQLIGPATTMWDTMKDKVFDRAAVEEKYGVGPDRLADAFGLIGDSADNIKGVPGIGPKIAGQLIAQYGNLESLLDRTEEIKQPKRRENLIEHADQARLAKRMVTLDDNVELDRGLDDLAPAPPDTTRLTELFTELEFRTLLAELDQSTDGQTPAQAEAEYQVITPSSDDDWAAFLGQARQAGRLALAPRLEGHGPRRAKLTALGLATGDQAAVADLPLPEPVALALAEADLAKAAFNLKSTALALRREGLDLRGGEFDVLIADYLLSPGRRASDPVDLARQHLGLELGGDDPAALAAAAWQLAEELPPQLAETGVDRVFGEIELPLIPVLTDMEWTGMALDRDQLEAMSVDFAARLDDLQARIIKAAGHEFNPNSPQQLGVVLFEELGLPQGKKTKTGYSTSVQVLEGLRDQHPLPGLILDYRQLAKLKSTYVDALTGLIDPDTGRIHTTFNQTVAATGRLSSSDPNLQNIPIRTAEGRRIRQTFVAGPGRVLISADYSQIELRFLAHYTEDRALVEAFRNGDDIHTQTAAQVFEVFPDFVDAEMRRRAKAINFGLIYGKTPFGLSQELGITTAEAAKFIDNYFNRFSSVRELMDTIIQDGRKKGYVTTMWGRRRYLPELRASNRMKRQNAERMAVNTVFQGSAADLIKLAMIKVDQALVASKLEAEMILQVHDELVFEVAEAAADECAELVKRTMEHAAELKVPLEVGLGRGQNWDDAH